MREAGYYWVKEFEGSDFEIALWTNHKQGDYWTIMCDIGNHPTELFVINETRIKNPDEK